MGITGLLAVNVLQLSCTDFDPFMDHTMFIIDWKGPLRLDPNSGVSCTQDFTVYTHFIIISYIIVSKNFTLGGTMTH